MLSDHQRIKWRRNIAENFNRLSRVHERYRQTTDRQTDRRQTTDGRTTTYSEHEHEFLLALIELFSLGVTAKALRAIIGSKSAILIQRGPVDRKFHVEGVALTNHSSSQKTRINDLSYDIKILPKISIP